ncbi:exported hypothetical protein [Pseudomonas brassicacearum]
MRCGKNAAIAACCSIAPHCLAVTPSRSSTHPTPTPTPAFPHAWAMPGQRSSRVPAPAHRPSTRKPDTYLTPVVQDSFMLPDRVVYVCSMESSCPGFLLTSLWALPRYAAP